MQVAPRDLQDEDDETLATLIDVLEQQAKAVKRSGK